MPAPTCAIASWKLRRGVRYPVLINDGSWPAHGHRPIRSGVQAATGRPLVRARGRRSPRMAGRCRGSSRAPRTHRRPALARRRAPPTNRSPQSIVRPRAKLKFVPPGVVVTTRRPRMARGPRAGRRARAAAGLCNRPGRCQRLHEHRRRRSARERLQAIAEATGRSWSGLGDDLDSITLCLNCSAKVFWARGPGRHVLAHRSDRSQGRRWRGSPRPTALGMGGASPRQRVALGLRRDVVALSRDRVRLALRRLRLDHALVHVRHDRGRDRAREGRGPHRRGRRRQPLDLRLAPPRRRHAQAPMGPAAASMPVWCSSTPAATPTTSTSSPARASRPMPRSSDAPRSCTSCTPGRPRRPATWTPSPARGSQRGAYAYVGSVHEPFLQAFVPSPKLAMRLAAGLPLGAAARLDDGEPWKISILGDPLITLGKAGPVVEKPLPLTGAGQPPGRSHRRDQG